METIGHVPFVDGDSGGNAFAVIRASEGTIALALSLETNGDIEVAFGVDTALTIRDALDRAIRHARGDAG